MRPVLISTQPSEGLTPSRPTRYAVYVDRTFTKGSLRGSTLRHYRIASFPTAKEAYDFVQVLTKPCFRTQDYLDDNIHIKLCYVGEQ